MTEATGATEAGRTASGRWSVLFGVWLLYFTFGILIAAMAPLVTPIREELGVSNAAMGAILGAWPLMYILAALPGGVALDRFGSRPMLFAAAMIMAASGLLRGVAETPFQMGLAVALFGLGGPLISVGAPKLIGGLFRGKARATAMGIYVTGPYLGNILALAATNGLVLPAVGGDWRNVMFFYGAMAGAAGIVWLFLTRRVGGRAGISEDGGRKLDLRAGAGLLRLPAVRLILALGIGVFFINHAFNNWLPEILRAAGFSAVEAGVWSAIPSAVGVIGALVVPRLATPERRLLVMGALILSSGVASVLLQIGGGAPLWVALGLQGVARGTMMTVAILILMETRDVSEDRLGLAGGLFFTAAEIGGVIGPLSFGVLSTLSGGFAVPLGAMTVLCALLIALLFRLGAVESARR